MTPAGYVDALVVEGEALARAAEGDLSARVPSCPAWDAAALVAHTGGVHRHKQAVLQRGSLDAPPRDLPWTRAPAGADALLGWYREGLATLAETLAAADPATPVWSWTSDRTVGFWRRRMAQETLVHRWDAEAAVGDPARLPGELAADGVDEWLRVWLADDPDATYAGPAGTAHLHRTDGPGEWLVDLRAWPPAVTDGHAKADAAVRGSAEDLLLVLWGRRPLSTVEVLGDARVVAALLAAPDL